MKKKVIIGISSFVIIGVLCIVAIKNYNENNKWNSAKSANSILLFKAYLAEYPSGKYEKDAKQSIDSLYWVNATILNSYESYKLYADSSYNRLHAQEADSLEQSALLRDAEIKNSYEAYQRYITLFPNGKYAVKVNDIADERLWKKTLKDQNTSSLQFYLNRFPEGKYSRLANDNLDDILWASAEQHYTQSGFENYSRICPNGKHISEANSMIKYFKAVEESNKQQREAAQKIYYDEGFEEGRNCAFNTPDATSDMKNMQVKTGWQLRYSSAPSNDVERSNFDAYSRGFFDGYH